MRVLSLLALLFLTGLQALALTNITTPSVSGQWTLAGSPYMVQVNISVPAAQTLKIEPGVEVKFSAGTRFNVFGQLIAKGTAAQPIVFCAADTTGWSLNNSTAGGWNGLHYMVYGGGGTDSSTLDHCTIRDCKYGYNNVVNEVNTFLTYRQITLSNCKFHHNTSGTGMYTAGMVIEMAPQGAGDTVVMDNCEIYDNSSVFAILRIQNYTGGFSHIQRCRIHHNNTGAPLWGVWNNALIENNEIDHNTMINDASPIKLSIGKAVIRGNKVHHNQCDQLAAVGVRSGQIDIENNLICNNEQLDGFCGATGGGGGIHLAHNEGGAAFANTFYRVRNNVIANNFSAYGGGGIYVYHARADIMNNTIVNNRAQMGNGNGILILDPASEVKVKNNLFKGNSVAGWSDSFSVLYIMSCSTLHFDYNYVPGHYSKAVIGQMQLLGQLIGDTTHNVIGTQPMLIAPTANNLVTTDATSANFGIQANSPCVDQGDTNGAWALPLDYAGNNRIMGPKIDIGAYEVVKGNPEGLHETWEKLDFSLFPNPAHGQVMLRTADGRGTIRLYSVDGNVLREQPVRGGETMINLSGLSSGLYFLTVEDGKKRGMEKVWVE